MRLIRSAKEIFAIKYCVWDCNSIYHSSSQWSLYYVVKDIAQDLLSLVSVSSTSRLLLLSFRYFLLSNSVRALSNIQPFLRSYCEAFCMQKILNCVANKKACRWYCPYPLPPVLKGKYNSVLKTTNSIRFALVMLSFAFFCCRYAIAFSLWRIERLRIRTKKGDLASAI